MVADKIKVSTTIKSPENIQMMRIAQLVWLPGFATKLWGVPSGQLGATGFPATPTVKHFEHVWVAIIWWNNNKEY